MSAIVEGQADAVAHFRLAAAANQANRTRDAIDSLLKAIALDADNAEYHYTLGRLCKSAGEIERAEQAYRDAVRLRPTFADAWMSLGILLRNADRPQEAEECQREALRIDPANHLATLNLGSALYSQKRLEEAAVCFRQVIERAPLLTEAHNNLGRALFDKGDVQVAIRHFRDALALNPDYFDAAEGLGKALFRMGQLDEAIEALLTAIRLNRQDIQTQILLTSVYCAKGKTDAARAVFERLLAEYPQSATLKSGLAAVLTAAGQYNKPRALFEQALALRPDDSWIRTNFALFLLRGGEYARAWEYYESRATGDHKSIERELPQPRWRGEPLAGKTLLVTSEQGLGDEIMFASLYPEISREAGHCMLEFDRRLEPLFQRSFPGTTLIAVDRAKVVADGSLPQTLDRPIDYWTPAGSLARYRRTAAEHFPSHKGYLVADAGKVPAWRERLQQLGPGLKVGLSWRGGVPHTGRVLRSASLPQLQPLLATKGTHWISLQYGNCREEIDAFKSTCAVPVHHWQEAIDDYDETAALVCALDLVVSVCTAVVHLSGALGQRVWVMAPHVAEWRYGREGERLLWYPSARVFRQPKPDAWPAVIAEVRRALQKLTRGS